MVVQHNLQAMNTNRQFNIAAKAQGKSSERLSSGYRINRAADDAAGLAISEKMRKQVRGLGRASDNAMEGISLIQTADGALEEVHDMLHRMNELAVQAANGINSVSDRRHIQDEVDQIKSEIDRVASTVKYNEIYLLDGHLADPAKAGIAAKEYKGRMADAYKEIVPKELEDNAGRLYSAADIKALSGMKIVYSERDFATTQSPAPGGAATMGGYDNLKSTLKTQIVPQAVVSIVDTFSDTFGYLRGSSIGIGLELYDDSSSSVLAAVGIGVPQTSDPLDVLYTLKVNIASLGLDASGNMAPGKREDLEHTIVHEMMHALMDEALTAGMMGYDQTAGWGQTAKYEFPDWFAEGMAQAAAGGCYNGNDWVNASLGITDQTPLASIQSIVTDPANKIGTGTVRSQYGTGYLASMYLGYLAGGRSVGPAAVAAGLDKLMDGVKGGKSLDEMIKKLTGGKYADTADFEAKFGTDSDSQQFVHDLVAAVGGGAGGLTNGSYAVTDVLPNRPLNVGLFELDTDVTMVNNRYPAGYKVLSGGNRGGSGTAGPTGQGTGWGFGTEDAGPVDKTPDMDIAIAASVSTGDGLKLQIGADSGNRMAIFIEGMGTSQIGVHNVDVQTQLNATRAIDMIAFALEQVSTQRSILGAYQNRLEHTVKNLDNVAENTQASESAIRDTDMAEEMVRYSNNNILQQAGQSMLAQANQSNQGVLQLVA